MKEPNSLNICQKDFKRWTTHDRRTNQILYISGEIKHKRERKDSTQKFVAKG